MRIPLERRDLVARVARIHHMWERPRVHETGQVPASDYLVVVPASDEPLYRYLAALFAGDARTHVIVDRRGKAGKGSPVERRRPRPAFSPFGVAVIRLNGDRPAWERIDHDEAGRRTRATMEGFDDRQRVDRWLEESQYLIGRIIPAYLDDRDRVRTRVESIDQDNERLRIELADARREIADLQTDLDFHRSERTRLGEVFHSMVEHLTALQGPVREIASRLDSQATADLRV
jgi:hypothetical protein